MDNLHFSNFPDCNSEDIFTYFNIDYIIILMRCSFTIVCRIIEDNLVTQYQIQCFTTSAKCALSTVLMAQYTLGHYTDRGPMGLGQYNTPFP